MVLKAISETVPYFYRPLSDSRLLSHPHMFGLLFDFITPAAQQLLAFSSSTIIPAKLEYSNYKLIKIKSCQTNASHATSATISTPAAIDLKEVPDANEQP